MRVDLTELDYDDLLKEFSNHINKEITDNFTRQADLQISTWQTADGYDVYVMMNGEYMSDMCWESDVYYYKPNFSDIIDRIVECDDFSQIYVDDLEEYLPDYDIIEWMQDDNPEKYDPDYEG